MPIIYVFYIIAVGVVQWRFASSDSGANSLEGATDPVATQWNSPTIDDIHLSASRPIASNEG